MKILQVILWAGSSPYSSETGPAHHRVEKGQLICKIVNEDQCKSLILSRIFLGFFVLYIFYFLFFKIFLRFFVFWFFLYLKIKLNIIFLNHSISQVLQPRKRLILRGSCPHSRLGHTSDIHSHSYSNVWFSHPAANITDISAWDGLHLQLFLCVSVFSDNWPSSPRRCSAESSPLPGQYCTCDCWV